MLDDENQDQSNQKISFESLDILIGKWKDGTFSEIIDDWKWIFPVLQVIALLQLIGRE